MNKAEIFYKDIGDYLSREEKLKIVSDDRSILNPALEMTRLEPNEHGDWISQRNSVFGEFIPLEPEQKFINKTNSFFIAQSLGTATNRDAWVYNFSEKELRKNIKKTITHYNEQLSFYISGKIKEPVYDSTKGNWTRDWLNQIKRKVKFSENKNEYRISLYRPFAKLNTYFDDDLNQERYQLPRLFPEKDSANLCICVHGLGGKKDFSTIITDCIPDLNSLEAGAQCFPLYWYEKKDKVQGGLFEKTEDEYIRHDAISDFILNQAKTRYDPKVTKEDIFYYVYGILHSPYYRKNFSNDLKKMLPRLPLVEKPADFWAFSDAGHKLADIHLNYEKQEPPKEVLINGKPVRRTPFPAEQLAINKITFPTKSEKDTIIYNSYLTISNIPMKAYEYIVNGKPAIEWVMERYAITTHKESGIKNDPNDWAKEHDNPQYILDLLLSVISVSIRTVDIVAGLPKVEVGII
jgi:predicted helicase